MQLHGKFEFWVEKINGMFLGPNGLHPMVLKEQADVTLDPLNDIFQSFWTTEALPEEWKRADVVPIFKRSSKWIQEIETNQLDLGKSWKR